jgi:hypothetical protein
MPRLLILLTPLLWGLASVHALAQPAGEQTPMAQAVAVIKLKPKWQRIEINEDPLAGSFPSFSNSASTWFFGSTVYDYNPVNWNFVHTDDNEPFRRPALTQRSMA